MVAIAAGIILLAILWIAVVPFLVDIGNKDGQDAALGWIVLVGATIVVGWIMFRAPAFQAEVEARKIRKRRGLRRSEMQRRGARKS